jgi:hypothetical protein
MLLETHVRLQRAGPDKRNCFNPVLARIGPAKPVEKTENEPLRH